MMIRENTFSIQIEGIPDCSCHSVFLDIETTGFSREHTIIYLAGCGLLHKGQLTLTQWFNQDGRSEKSLLESLLRYLCTENACRGDLQLITFNGETFDLPYLKTHCQYLSLDASVLSGAGSLDLYRGFLPFRKLFGLPHARQKDLEALLGIHREDSRDGGDLIRVYKDYLIHRDEEAAKALLLHNSEDILGLARLNSLWVYPRLFKEPWEITDITPDEERGSLRLTCGLSQEMPLPFQAASEDYSVQGQNGRLIFTLPYRETTLKHFYSDYKNYYYLPEEDCAIHKSVGRYVSRTHREQAGAKNCYLKKDGIFFKIPPPRTGQGLCVSGKSYADIPQYRSDWADTDIYLELEDLFRDCRGSQPFVVNYLKDVFKTILLSQ